MSTTGGQANGAGAGPDATIGGGSDFGPSISADGTSIPSPRTWSPTTPTSAPSPVTRNSRIIRASARQMTPAKTRPSAATAVPSRTSPSPRTPATPTPAASTSRSATPTTRANAWTSTSAPGDTPDRNCHTERPFGPASRHPSPVTRRRVGAPARRQGRCGSLGGEHSDAGFGRDGQSSPVVSSMASPAPLGLTCLRVVASAIRRPRW